jgi:lysophospholipase L1-like esterase
MRYLIIIFFSSLGLSLLYSQSDSLYLRLPEYIYTTTVSKFSVYFKNIIQTKEFDNYSFSVSCPAGYAEELKYNLDSLEVGVYNFSVDVKDSLGNVLESDESQIIVTDHGICHNDTLKILYIGDSLTLAGVHLRNVQIMLEEISTHPLKFLGTQYNTINTYFGLDNDLFSESHLGWTWHRYANYADSPFVFQDQYPYVVDFDKYFVDSLSGNVPDIIVFFLGVCDVTSLTGTISIETIDGWIDTKIFHETRMGKMISSVVDGAPKAKIGIVLIPPANERHYTYTDSLYGIGEEGWWNRKQKHHRLNQRYIDYFNAYGYANISVIPAYLNIDTFSDFGEIDPVHPTINGYNKIGQTVYGWLKYQISQLMTEPKNLQIINSGSSSLITWDASSGTYRYHVYRSTDPYSGFVEIGTSSITEFTDNDISGHDRLFYRVTAENSLSE